MKVVDITENECEDDYISGLESEAEYFASVFQIDNLTDDIKADIVDLYKEIYSYSKYTVSAATKQDDKTYSVKMTVEPHRHLSPGARRPQRRGCGRLQRPV